MTAPRQPTLFLHVGTHKTGTSSMQATLHANRQRLAERGVCYPTEGVYCTPAGWAGPPPEGGHRYLAFSMMGTWPHWDDRDHTAPLTECRAALRADLTAWRARWPERRADAVLSSEYWFRDVDPAALHGLVEGLGYRVVVIAYLRRQDEFICSLHDQQVRAALTTAPLKSSPLMSAP